MMFKLITRSVFFLLLVLPAIIQIAHFDGTYRSLALAGDVLEDEDDGQVETDDGDQGPNIDTLTPTGTGDDDDDDDEDKPLKPSPDVDTLFLFVKPTESDLPAGSVVDFLVGFTNKGEKDFTIDSMDASFRYPMDFSFYIQNFSTVHFSRVVKPKDQVTLAYSFVPSDTFASRPFGLTVNLNYHDSDGNPFLDAVFNETVNIIEIEDGLDGETVFLYVFLVVCSILLLVVGYQLLSSYRRKRPLKSKPVEMGTSNPNDVDFDWLPKETLQEIRKTTPRQSPRQRRTKRSTGSDE